ncbi:MULTISPECIES: hypothetical protein [Photobacterium]|uniref:Uncharacterized protein n=2 Tax=Photobacterium TaxID=657 RepID=A0A2N4USE6_9GAMM|nr:MULTISPECIES: hypothetical protein [Photobacterium]MCD9468381.1 hypothetical protein [Photobacterium iliopiscarium]MEC6883015.1 hypothetical protein [Photobacterium piscicola]MEC6898269.1 hypothetical protein [Photobacterium piscicola]PLC57917.1 hypothetical protein CIK00_10695 [Photobacterium carnosum]
MVAVIEERKRGFWLTAFLVLMVIANALSVFVYFVNPDMIITAFPKISLELAYLLGSVCLFNVFLAINIWMWKKLAIYGFYIVVIFGVLINLYIGLGLIGSLSGLMGGMILFLVTRKKMQYFV